jgi:hypothetical protein
MIPILMSVAGAVAGKALVSAYEAMFETSDKKKTEADQSGSVVKTNIGGAGISPEATKVTVSSAGLQKNLASRYDPAKLTPARLEKLAGELKANGMITADEQRLMTRIAVEARQTDALSESGNRYLSPKNMIDEMNNQAALSLKTNNQAEAAKYQKLAGVLNEISTQAGRPKNAGVTIA